MTTPAAPVLAPLSTGWTEVQPARKQLRPSEATPPKTLTELFEEACARAWQLADELVRLRATYEKSCAPGLPMEVILMEICKHQTCKCIIAQDVILKNRQTDEFERKP
jgi:hypothetical protein